MVIRPSPVPDIRIVQNLDFPKYSVTVDWSLREDGTLDDTEALATGVVIALGTNSLADIDDQLPDPDSTDRCGWWGDLECDTIWNAWPIGSKLWLMRRAAILPSDAKQGSTLVHIRNYIFTCLQPFVDNKICSSFDATVTRIDKQRIDAIIQIYRGPKTMIELRFQILWDEAVESMMGKSAQSPFSPPQG
jgi:phage gp46-like protein